MNSEAEVKKAVKVGLEKILKCWYFMPVPYGFGVSGIPDFIGCCNGFFFAIETKAPGRRGQCNQGLSGLQVRIKKLIEAAGGLYFVVDDAQTCEAMTTKIKDLGRVLIC